MIAFKIVAILFICLTSLWVGVNYYLGSPRHRGPVSDHFDGNRFYNPQGAARKSFLDLVRWRLSSKREHWQPQEESIIPGSPEEPFTGELVVTWINHSSVLLRTTGFAILVDPVWSPQVGPFSLIGPKRIHPPGIDFEKLPQIDGVLVTHDHYDHLDLPTLTKLAERFNPVFITGLGNGWWMKKAMASEISELDWWQTHSIGPARITFLPAKHWSGRSFTDRQNTLWGSFLIELDGYKVLSLCDTGFSEQLFRQLAEKAGGSDLCLIPIGAYEPRWFMKSNHLNPEEALRTAEILECKRATAIHHGTFQLSDEGREDPPAALQKALKSHDMANGRFTILKPGEAVRLSSK